MTYRGHSRGVIRYRGPKAEGRLLSVIRFLTPDTRLRGRSRFGAAKARTLTPYRVSTISSGAKTSKRV